MKVSVCITTFNKEKFIRKTLDSVTSQITNFDYEILIYDDASTDNTVSILKEYLKKHENSILVEGKKNEYGNGLYGVNERNLFTKAKGEYIAMCDGDDYWTDNNKLQKQVDFLEENKEYVLCCHDGFVFHQDSERFDEVYKKKIGNPITTKTIISLGGNLCPTSSIMFRNNRYVYPDFIFKAKSNDRALTYFLMTIGKFWFIDEKMCVYRVHKEGLIAAGNRKVRLGYIKSNIELLFNYKNFCEINEIKMSKLIKKEISNSIKLLFYFDSVKENVRFIQFLQTKDVIKVVVYKVLIFFKIKKQLC